MIEALQTHLALDYEFFETPADIVESATFEMYPAFPNCVTIITRKTAVTLDI